MEGEKFVRDLEDGERVTITLAVVKKYGLRQYRSKFGKYFVLEAGDRTGRVLVKYWGTDEDFTERLYNEIREGDVIRVSGEYTSRGGGTIEVDGDRGELVKVYDYDTSRFLQHYDGIEDAMHEIFRYVEMVENEYLSRLLDIFFSSDSFVEEFRSAPAATFGPYASIGGLAAHTLNVTRACESLARIYGLDEDFMITAALLHDVGRIESYEVDTGIRPNNRGKLLGHTVLSYNMVEERIREIVDFPADLRDRLLHAIISHHSPIVDNVPQRIRTREAYILFYADMLDLSLKEFEMEGDEEWAYSRKMGREIYLG